MTYLDLNTVTLNGKEYSKKEILDFKLRVDSHFEKVIEFLQEWFSDSSDIVVQTSGSTGVPKQIYIPKQSFVESAKNTCTYLNLDSKTNALLCIPVKYIGGKMMVIRALVCGYNLWIEEPSSSPLENFNEQIDFLAITPMQAQKCVQKTPKKIKKTNQVIIGGGVVSESFINEIQGFNNQFYSTYGMTETVSHIALKKLNGKNKSNFFEVLPSYSVFLNSDDCLVIDCPTLFPEPIITNDIAELTDKGFKWLGRKDNVINSGGIKLFPEEIERKIKTKYPNLIFYVTSKKDELLGEKLILVSVKEVEFNFNNLGLDKFQIPKEILIKEISFTETGKIIRKRLSE